MKTNQINLVVNNIVEGLLKKKKGINSDAVVFFLGAGFSMKLPGESGGIGNGREVAIHLSNKLLGTQEEDLQRAAEYIEVVLNRRRLVSEVREYLKANYESKDSHRYLAEIISLLNQPTELVYSTNYDTYLEDEYRTLCNNGKDLSYWFFDNDISMNKTLYKIHGCINSESQIVLTSEDYYKVKSNKPLMSRLYNLLRENTCVFIGFSMEDQDLLDLLFSIRADKDDFGDQKHYLVVPENGINEWRATYLNKKFNIDHIPLGRDEFLSGILDVLKKKVTMSD